MLKFRKIETGFSGKIQHGNYLIPACQISTQNVTVNDWTSIKITIMYNIFYTKPISIVIIAIFLKSVNIFFAHKNIFYLYTINKNIRIVW
jgi:hypothetical protein